MAFNANGKRGLKKGHTVYLEFGSTYGSVRYHKKNRAMTGKYAYKEKQTRLCHSQQEHNHVKKQTPTEAERPQQVPHLEIHRRLDFRKQP
ncbi:hypothetical protein [Acinetobacter sp.]|uniref:hypothetical protein n=1 Tax=Acinetobacter sp. TaxID=472 RepID=UPI00388D86E8